VFILDTATLSMAGLLQCILFLALVYGNMRLASLCQTASESNDDFMYIHDPFIIINREPNSY